MTDPNWLYSSIVQSSAAIVAIIGGLLTATVVNLVSRRNALLEERTDLDRQSSILQRERDRVAFSLERLRARHYLDDHDDEILEHLIGLKPSEAMNVFRDLCPDNITDRAWEEEGEEFVKLIQAERKWLLTKLKGMTSIPRSFWDWRDANKYDSDDHETFVLEALYDHIFEQIQSKRVDGSS